jgi:hypothetical protein
LVGRESGGSGVPKCGGVLDGVKAKP